MDKAKVLIVSHKDFVKPDIAGYVPVFVGPNKPELEGYKDSSGTNIAEKNPYYCELTALYWYWKNAIESAEYVGFCHYRRYFSKRAWTNSHSYFLTVEDIDEIMKEYDIILPLPKKLSCTVAENYYKNGEGFEKDLKTLRNIIAEKYADYIQDYDKVMQSNSNSYFNMFIMNRDLLDRYCTWVFEILGEVEKQTDLRNYTKAQARIYGYLSELLLNVWTMHHKLRVFYCPVVQTDIDGRTFTYRYFKQKLKETLLRG